ncbi:DUF5336 domain-containing protein [Candidatus Mycobacterium methanotrophicum]|uniref:DUF5336 domain-containing protein n=1 Tax=Candidatus Mycobacterium methanotrophicum TaxID=2943498 RepID=A0ABY4QQQ6_9MYCO|nr:DUF5336 domain-containing protein [Candidatus Mycobacterium methanotrophicum]UQX12114.1 DUF5336 domain-containing protein [Candidatus Mycobacterium methanotrophicum]
MTYPPTSPGYPPAQSQGGYGASAASSFTKSDDGKSNLKLYLTIGVAALGLASYLLSYGPMITRILPNGDEVVESGSTLPIDLALLAALLAGVSLLPKAKYYAGVVAAVAALGGLLLIEDTIGASGRGWALWFALGSGVIQAILAVSALLLDAGVITPPAPRQKYDQYGHYGQYGGYYGQQNPYQQSGYGSQYGGYPSGPSTGGFSSPGPQSGPIQSSQSGHQQGSQQGSPTPPTGFPSFSPPPPSGSGSQDQGNSANHASSGQSQPSYGQGQEPQVPSSPPSQS